MCSVYFSGAALQQPSPPCAPACLASAFIGPCAWFSECLGPSATGGGIEAHVNVTISEAVLCRAWNEIWQCFKGAASPHIGIPEYADPTYKSDACYDYMWPPTLIIYQLFEHQNNGGGVIPYRGKNVFHNMVNVIKQIILLSWEIR